jgi:hypothetical protein
MATPSGKHVLNGFVALISVVFTLVLVEVILRLAAPLYTAGIVEAYQYDSEIGVRVRPGIHLLKTVDHQQEIRVNELGTVNFQETFGDYSMLIFALGDSYTQGTGLPADAAYPFQLDLLLNVGADGEYRPRYGVVNLGLSGQGGEQSLRLLRRYAGRVRSPGVCLYLGSENDHQDDVLFRGGYRHNHLVEGSPRWGIWVRPLQWAGATQIGVRAKVAIGTLRHARLMRTEASNDDAQSVAEIVWPVVEQVVEACAASGAATILSWSDGSSESYPWLRTRATENGIAFADWYPSVVSIQAAIPALESENPHSGGHWRVWVNQMIARAFAAEIANLDSGGEFQAGEPR